MKNLMSKGKNQFSEERFRRMPIVGILRGYTPYEVERLIQIYMDCGFTTIEVTMNSDHAGPMIRKLVAEYGERLNVGAGTVRTMEELHQALQAGAQFIVTPIVDPQVISTCVACQIPIFPGAYTPSEVYQAWKLGATAVKIFPAVTGGLTHIKAIRAPLEMIPLVPTGGVGAHNLGDFFDAGVVGVGMGSQLFPGKHVEAGDWESVRTQMMEVKSAYDSWSEKIKN